MRIPFANRTADVDLPAVQGQPKVTVKAVIDAFRDQVPRDFETLFEAFVLLSPRKVRITCRSPRALEEVIHLGLAFRNSPVTFHPCRTAKWVNITRLSYGVPQEAISAALQPYGKVLNVKMDTYKGVYVGVRNALMEVTTPIPSSLKIAEHWVNVFYPGQTPTCFACRQGGHTRANCPRAIAPVIPADDAAADETVPPLLSPARDDIVKTLMGSVVDRVVDHTHAIPPQTPLSFAEATQRGLDVLFDTDLPINDDGPGGLQITDSGQNPTTALASDVPNIIDKDRSGLKINDDGHHDATKVVTDDLKINDEGHCGPNITDEDHRPITVKMGTAVAPHVSGADNSSTDLTDEDVSSVDDGDEADDDDDDDNDDDDDDDDDDG